MTVEIAQEQTDMARVPYSSAVGAVLYASLCTRPDVAYAVGILSRFSACPGRQHWEALKRVIRYLLGTAGRGLQFDGSQGLRLVAYADADFSSCPDTSRSTSGQVLLLGGCAVEWKSKKQPIVAQSTTEAEYVALAEVAKGIVWMRGLLDELGCLAAARQPFAIATTRVLWLLHRTPCITSAQSTSDAASISSGRWCNGERYS